MGMCSFLIYNFVVQLVRFCLFTLGLSCARTKP